jgi:hypothetical protein
MPTDTPTSAASAGIVEVAANTDATIKIRFMLNLLLLKVLDLRRNYPIDFTQALAPDGKTRLCHQVKHSITTCRNII